MLVTLAGMSIEGRDSHLRKALLPILVTPEGMVTGEFRALARNALLPMVVTPASMMRFLMLSFSLYQGSLLASAKSAMAPVPLMVRVCVDETKVHFTLSPEAPHEPLASAQAAEAVIMTNISVMVRRWSASLNPCCCRQGVGDGFVVDGS